ncbi:hypothetical protein [Sphingomonas sp. UYP23]
MFGKVLVFLGTLSISAIAAAAEPTPSTLAAAFGARVGASSPALSPDGRFLVYIAPGAGQLTVAMVMNLADGTTTPITSADGKPLKLNSCGWSAADRLVCLLSGISTVNHTKLALSRLVAVDADGKHTLPLSIQYGLRQQDGEVLDWMTGVDGTVLMSRGNGAVLVNRLCCKTDGGDSRRESSGIDRRNAQTCRTCVSYDELA